MDQSTKMDGVDLSAASIEPDPETVAGHPGVRQLVEETDDWCAKDQERDVPRLAILSQTDVESGGSILTMTDHPLWPGAITRFFEPKLALQVLHAGVHEDPMVFPPMPDAVGMVFIGTADAALLHYNEPIDPNGGGFPIPDAIGGGGLSRVFLVHGVDGSDAVMMSQGGVRTWYQAASIGELGEEFRHLADCMIRTGLIRELLNRN